MSWRRKLTGVLFGAVALYLVATGEPLGAAIAIGITLIAWELGD